MTRPTLEHVRTRCELLTAVPFECDLVPVMSLRPPDRQAFLSRSCPNNIGNLRQLTWYCRQVAQSLASFIVQYYYYLCFFLNSTCPPGRLFFIRTREPFSLLASYLLQNKCSVPFAEVILVRQFRPQNSGDFG